MKIGIDARFLTHPQPGGFKTYTKNLIDALSRIDTTNEYVLYLDRQPDHQELVSLGRNFQVCVVPYTVPFIGFLWREQVTLLRQAEKDKIYLLHSPCLTGPLNPPFPLVITVHDMFWISRENFTSRRSWSLKRRLIDWYNYLIPKYAIQRASAIITVSNASKRSIIERLGLQPERITVTYEAAGPEFHRMGGRNQPEAVGKKYELPPGYILALGAADPRKNLNTLIHSYSLIPEGMREKHKLAIVWTHPFLVHEISKTIDELGLFSQVRFLTQVTNEDLAMLYNAAGLFVFPSRFEGFGLPLLEAMACGVPVVTANNSSIPEIAGDAAVFFDANDARGMAEEMIRVLSDEGLQRAMIEKGFSRAGEFSWEKCARETLGVYTDVYRISRL